MSFRIVDATTPQEIYHFAPADEPTPKPAPSFAVSNNEEYQEPAPVETPAPTTKFDRMRQAKRNRERM